MKQKLFQVRAHVRKEPVENRRQRALVHAIQADLQGEIAGEELAPLVRAEVEREMAR